MKSNLEKIIARAEGDSFNEKDILWMSESLIKLVRALAFYADEENWSPSSESVCPAMIQGEDIRSHPTFKKRFVGGDIAIKGIEEVAKGDCGE